MADRRPFEEKYCSIHFDWNIDKDLTAYIVRRYTKKLEEELIGLQKNKIKLPKFFSDRRTDEDYVYDLIDGWLVEDIICDAWLRINLQKINSRIKIKQKGTDSDRTLQKYNPEKITTNPDFIFSFGNIDRPIELQMAREARQKLGYDMKESKVKKSMEQNNIFLWIIIPEGKYFFINPSDYFQNKTPTVNHLWGGKMVFTISPSEVEAIGLEKMKEGIHSKYHKLLGI